MARSPNGYTTKRCRRHGIVARTLAIVTALSLAAPSLAGPTTCSGFGLPPRTEFAAEHWSYDPAWVFPEDNAYNCSYGSDHHPILGSLLDHSELTAFLKSQDFLDGNLRGKRIGIVGGGIAAAYAAVHLADVPDTHVSVFEARGELGGRIRTHYFPNTSSADPDRVPRVELGAMRLKRSAERSLFDLLDRLELETNVLYPADAPNYLFMNGHRQLMNATPSAWDWDALGLSGVRDTYRRSFKDIIRELLVEPVANATEAGCEGIYGALSVDTELAYLKDCGLSNVERRYLTTAGNTACYQDRVSAFDWWVDSGNFASEDRSNFHTVVGGMGKIFQAVQQAVGERATWHLNAHVVSVDEAARRVCYADSTVVAKEGRATIMPTCETFDAVIVTLPAPVMSNVDFTPELPGFRREANTHANYDEATKVAIKFNVDTAPWDPDAFPWGTYITSDQSASQLYFLNDSVVLSYMWGSEAERMAAYNKPERVRQVLLALHKVTGVALNTLEAAVESSVSKSWRRDPYFGGAFALYGPGNLYDACLGLVSGGNIADVPYGRDSCVRFTSEQTDPQGHAWLETSLRSVATELKHLSSSTCLSRADDSAYDSDESCRDNEEL